MFLMGIGPIARWKKSSVPELAVRLKWAFAIALISALLIPFVMGHWSIFVSFGLLMAAWVALSGMVNLYTRLKQMSLEQGRTFFGSFLAIPNAYYGMLLAHWGVAVFIVGVTLVNGYEVEKDVKMAIGNTVTIGEYTIRLDGIKDLKGPNYTGVEGSMAILVDGKEINRMYPQKRLYNVQQMPMTEAAIDTGFTRDLYISLGELLNDGSWVVRVYLKPFIDWIWGGAFLMALGGILAVSDRRYRRVSQETGVSEK